MNFSLLLRVLEETELSPEQLAPYLGVGNMTLRRWKQNPGANKIPKLYKRSVVEGVYQLLIDGKLKQDSRSVQEFIGASTSLSFQAVFKGLGVVDTYDKAESDHQEKIAIALSYIGGSDTRRAEVDASEKKLVDFKKLGQDWQERITHLWSIVRSKKFSNVDKMVAYGALFYLIFPLDLIPDHIPVVGLLDDFGILGMATAFYSHKFSGQR